MDMRTLVYFRNVQHLCTVGEAESWLFPIHGFNRQFKPMKPAHSQNIRFGEASTGLTAFKYGVWVLHINVSICNEIQTLKQSEKAVTYLNVDT